MAHGGRRALMLPFRPGRLQAVSGLDQPLKRHAGEIIVLLAMVIRTEVRVGKTPYKRDRLAAVETGHSLGGFPRSIIWGLD
jgi:hypothetical protein